MSNITEQDLFYLSEALKIARFGEYTAKPNPAVGCILVKDHKIIGLGFHKEAGMPHAEIEALKNCNFNADGATCYITLEPCFHFGKTPPCVDALIKAKISRVVIISLDCNPKVSGQSIKKLKDNNITVDILDSNNSKHLYLIKEAYEINKGFFKRIKYNKPYVISKIAISMDGCIALKNGYSKWITGEGSRNDVHELRAKMSAIITTNNTVIKDNAKLNPRLNINNQALDPKYWPIRVVLDKNLQTDFTKEIYKLPGKVIICVDRKYLDKNFLDQMVLKKIEKFQANNIKIIYETDINKILELLAIDYECNQVLIESGARFNAILLKEKILDELIIYKSSKILGKDAISMFDISDIKEEQLTMDFRSTLDNNLNYFKLIRSKVIENDVKLIYKNSFLCLLE